MLEKTCNLVNPAGGEERFSYFKNVVAVPNARKTTLAWSFAAFSRSELWVALITFLYLDFLDATGTLFSMGKHQKDSAGQHKHRQLHCNDVPAQHTFEKCPTLRGRLSVSATLQWSSTY